ncbi:MAG: hypothetical protein H0T77_09270 [Pyrinomonadaceae bacterium]|nr:hypothetical protein [Pyrinomonadaceae bacterium]
MTLRRIVSTILFATLIANFATSALPVLAQSSGPSSQKETKDDETNLDTQLYLLIATNQDVDDAKLPSSLAPVVAQLRGSLTFKNYRLAATLINRVKNDGRLSLQWVGGPLLPSAAASANTPSFNEFKVNNVRLTADASGQDVVRMEGFRFGARIPIQTGTAVASNGPAAPTINYENTGLNTDISMREGEPVVVGTLNVGPSGDAIILVISARRSSKR